MRKIVLVLLGVIFTFFGLGAIQVNGASVFYVTQSTISNSCQNQNEVALPVLMYHRVLENGNKSRYIITPEQLEDDLIELKKAGYTAVLPSEVIKFVEEKGDLPSRPVMLTFDDGHYNNLLYALPLFKKHGFKGVVNVVGKFCEYASTSGDNGNVKSSFLTWDEIAKLKHSGLFEIGSHTYNMHDYKPRFGLRRMEDETDEKYYEALVKDDIRLRKALKDKSGVETNIFAYPFGAYYNDSLKLISGLGYKMIFTANVKINYIKPGDFDTLLQLNRINREGDWTSEKMIETFFIMLCA